VSDGRDLLGQYRKTIDGLTETFMSTLKRLKFGDRIKKDEAKTKEFYSLFNVYLDAMKQNLKEGAFLDGQGRPFLDCFKQASAIAGAIMQTQFLSFDETDIDETESSPVAKVAYPNESFAYYCCTQILRNFGVNGQQKRSYFRLPEDFGFSFPTISGHMDAQPMLNDFSFEKFFCENLRHHFGGDQVDHNTLFAFANFLNVLEIASDCNQSRAYRRYYYPERKNGIYAIQKNRVKVWLKEAILDVHSIIEYPDEIESFLSHTEEAVERTVLYYENEVETRFPDQRKESILLCAYIKTVLHLEVFKSIETSRTLEDIYHQYPNEMLCWHLLLNAYEATPSDKISSDKNLRNKEKLTAFFGAAHVESEMNFSLEIFVHAKDGSLDTLSPDIVEQILNMLYLRHQMVTAPEPCEKLLFRLAIKQTALYSLKIGTPVGVIYLDIDKFKQINDDHGHETAGDLCLSHFANILHDVCKDIGDDAYAGRYGGEEFIIIVQDATNKKLEWISEEINKRFNQLHRDDYRTETSQDIYSKKYGKPKYDFMSASIAYGIVPIGNSPVSDGEFGAFVKQLDHALYQVKAQDGNNHMSIT
jgi:diguanylate cyclase (GGDEF)-like protein